jgi:hypothetical protein
MSSFCSSCEELEEAGVLVEEAGVLVEEAGVVLDEAGVEVAEEVAFDEAAELVPAEEVPVLPHPAKMRAEEAKTSNNAEVLIFIVFPPYFFEKLSV